MWLIACSYRSLPAVGCQFRTQLRPDGDPTLERRDQVQGGLVVRWRLANVYGDDILHVLGHVLLAQDFDEGIADCVHLSARGGAGWLRIRGICQRLLIHGLGDILFAVLVSPTSSI